jgi:hypothetical protein
MNLKQLCMFSDSSSACYLIIMNHVDLVNYYTTLSEPTVCTLEW